LVFVLALVRSLSLINIGVDPFTTRWDDDDVVVAMFVYRMVGTDVAIASTTR
jgi:hypothetical protein